MYLIILDGVGWFGFLEIQADMAILNVFYNIINYIYTIFKNSTLIALKFKLYLLNNFYFGIIFSRIMNTNNRKKIYIILGNCI